MKRHREETNFLATELLQDDRLGDTHFAELFILYVTSIAEILERLPTEVHKDFHRIKAISN